MLEADLNGLSAGPPDMAPVCEIAREYIQSSGLTGRFSAVASDLFEGPYPKGADVILLGHILHDWSDDGCCKILRNCSAALPARGVLLISKSVLKPDFSAPAFALMKDLTMLVACEPGARERTEAEYRSLLNETGFDTAEVIRLYAPRDLVVARKRTSNAQAGENERNAKAMQQNARQTSNE
jgi:hypothetical protein